ncbi:Toll-like receptor 6 [Manis javanica]|nr:Toll-like receptor 6 [Manis javanica]
MDSVLLCCGQEHDSTGRSQRLVHKVKDLLCKEKFLNVCALKTIWSMSLKLSAAVCISRYMQCTMRKEFHFILDMSVSTALTCNTALLTVIIGITGLMLAIIVTVLCIYFDLPGISGCEQGSAWMKGELRPNLEKEDIWICLYERIFVPAGVFLKLGSSPEELL